MTSIVYQFVQLMLKDGDDAQKEMILYFLANATTDQKELTSSLIKHTDYLNVLLYQLVDTPKLKLDHLKVIIWNIQNLVRNDMLNEKMLHQVVYICKISLEIKNEVI